MATKTEVQMNLLKEQNYDGRIDFAMNVLFARVHSVGFLQVRPQNLKSDCLECAYTN